MSETLMDGLGEGHKVRVTLDNKLKTESEIIVGDSRVDDQHPFPTNGDSVYCKDVNISESDMGNFSGSPCDLFDDIFSEVANITSDNPKIIKIVFNRTIEAHSIGIGCLSTVGDFSNVVLKLIDGSGNVRKTIDDSANNTKYKSFDYKFTPEKFDGVIFEFHTSDSVCITNVVIKKSVNVTSRIEAVSELTGEVESIKSFRNALNVTRALVHKLAVNEYAIRDLGISTTFAVASSSGDTSVTVVSSTGFVVGDLLKISQNGTEEVGVIIITNIVGNVITLDRPLALDNPIGTNIETVENNMTSLAGTLTSPQIYRLAPPSTQKWQITRILISMTDTGPMDDDKFGSLPALTNGVVIRAETAGGRILNLTNWKSGKGLVNDMFNVDYPIKTPAGNYALRGRWTFTEGEFIVELDGAEGHFADILIQDDLTGMNNFRIKAQGRIFGG